MSEYVSPPRWKLFGGIVTTAFNVSRKTYLRMIIFSKNRWHDTFFRLWVECFGILSKDCRWGSENCFLRAYTNIFSKRYFQKKVLFYFSFWDRGRQFFGPSLEIFRRSCENCFLCAHNNTSSTFFWKIL